METQTSELLTTLQVLQACDRCHSRKSRCNKQRPSCLECQKVEADCQYSDRRKDPMVKKSQVEKVERRLRQSEAKNKALSSELSKLRLRNSTRNMNETGSVLSPTRSESFGHGSKTYTAQDSTASTDIISEVSSLVSNAAGDRHFLGSTSGVLFAQLVRESVNISGSQNHAARSPSGSLGRTIAAEVLPLIPSRFKREALPSEDVARKLVLNYLAHDHLAFPFLLPSFLVSVQENVYSIASYYDENHFEAFVLDMVLAIANIGAYKYDWQTLPGAEIHLTRAMSRIEEVLQAGSLESLQAILLLCQYRTGSSTQDTSTSMWHLVGTAVRTAFELGLHHESSYVIKNNAHGHTMATKIQFQELRRRCYWSVFCMDRIVSITLGRPLAINLNDVDVELPSPQHEHLFNEGLPSRSQLISRTSIFVHLIEYRKLCGKIMRSLHGLRKTPDKDERQMYGIRDTLSTQLDQWWEESKLLNLPATEVLSQPPQISTFMSIEWYEVLYRNASLMLFRPSPMLADISKDSETLQKIFISSKHAILLYASLHRSKKINYSWITLHSVFMAGLSYIYAVSRHFRERRRQTPTGATLKSDISTIEIVHDTRACSKVLVAVSERWNAFRNCHEVFDRLSDAVLEDAIKLQSAPRNSSRHPDMSSNPLDALSASSQSRTQAYVDSSPTQQTSGWFSNDSRMLLDSGFFSGTTPLAVDSEFQNCFGELQDIYQHDDNDPVVQLSQDWAGYLEGFDQFLPAQVQGDEFFAQ